MFYFREKVHTSDSAKRIEKEQTSERNNKTGKSSEVDKGKRVRKALIYTDETKATGSVNAAKSITKLENICPPRKISTDMFELHSIPESDCLSSDDITRLSGESPKVLSEGENTFNSSLGELDNSIVTLQTLEMDVKPQANLYTPAFHPPRRTEVLAKMKYLNLPEKIAEEPFYSNPSDVAKSIEVGNTMLKIKSKSVIHLEEFEGSFSCFSKVKGEIHKSKFPGLRTINVTPVLKPPSSKSAKQWLEDKILKENEKEIKESKIVKRLLLPSSPKNLVDDNIDSDSLSLVSLSQRSVLEMSGDEPEKESVNNTPDNISGKHDGISPLMASTPIHIGHQSKMRLTVFKHLPLIPEDQLLEASPQLVQSTAKVIFIR